MKSVYGSLAVQERAAALQPGPADLEAYAKVEPAGAERLQQLQTVNRVMGTSAIAGTLGSAVYAWRLTRYVPFTVSAALIAPFAFGWMGEDVAQAALGTWKWDNLKAVEEYHAWVERRAAAGAGDGEAQ